MADPNTEVQNDVDPAQDPSKSTPTPTNKSNDDSSGKDVSMEDRIAAEVAKALKPIKEKLDSAYGQRDEALSKVAEFEKQQREAELKRLEEEGKHKEAFDLKIAEERAAREALEKQNLELTRNIAVRDELRGYDFRNKNASEMAFREVVGDLVRNEKGEWVHKTGATIAEAVKTVVESPDYEFLLRPKVNSGSGSTTVTPSSSDTAKRNIFDMPQDEVLKLAAEGKLRKT